MDENERVKVTEENRDQVKEQIEGEPVQITKASPFVRMVVLLAIFAAAFFVVAVVVGVVASFLP